MEKRVIKFRYVIKHKPTGSILTFDTTLDEIERSGNLWGLIQHELRAFSAFEHNYQVVDRLQFTGLLDKAGKPIYEGDKVRFWTNSTRNKKEGITEEVRIERGLLLPFYDPCYTEDEQGDWFEDVRGFEIIGNIYQPTAQVSDTTKAK